MSVTGEKSSRGVTDHWADGQLYEAYVGRWSRRVAVEFLHWLARRKDVRWLDIGCGTGALTESILQESSPKTVTGIDTSERYIAFARHKVQDERAEFRVGSVEPIDYPDDVFDAVPGSDQLQVNLLGTVQVPIDQSYALRGLVAIPLRNRSVNIDGLKRSISLSLGVQYAF